MKHIADKVAAGVITLSKVPTPTLIQWANETQCQRDKDLLGCEIMYRRDGKDGMQ